MRAVRRTLRIFKIALYVIATMAAVAALVAGGFFFHKGYRITTIATPSMSPAIPVQSLVVTKPPTGPIHVGQVVYFHPTGDAWGYVHRVYAVAPGPIYTTKGDNDPLPDVWPLTKHDVSGVVVAVLPDVGWVMHALPIIGSGLLIGVLLGFLVPLYRRWALAGSLCVSLLAANMRLHPLVRWQIITVNERAHRAYAWLFNTGALPIRIRTSLGTTYHILPGHSAHVVANAGNQVALSAMADFNTWQLAVAGVLVMSPALVAIAVAVRIILGQESEAESPALAVA